MTTEVQFQPGDMVLPARPFLCLSPSVCYGKPTIGFSRLYVQVVAEAWWHGEMPEAAIYSCWPACSGRPGLLLACWWMARYGSDLWRRRWKPWLALAEGPLWHGDYQLDLPPQREV